MQMYLYNSVDENESAIRFHFIAIEVQKCGRVFYTTYGSIWNGDWHLIAVCYM
jgi:hypothetical protein